MTDVPTPPYDVRTVHPGSLVREPWRNGAGATRVVTEQDDPAAGTTWRLSLADLDREVAFSAYPGVDRCSTVLAGAGLRLLVDDVPTSAGRLEVVRYAGEAAVRADPVDGAVVNLNLMVTRGAGSGQLRVRRVDGPVTWQPPTVAVVVVEGGLDLGDGLLGRLGTVLVGDRAVLLTARDAVVVEVSVS